MRIWQQIVSGDLHLIHNQQFAARVLLKHQNAPSLLIGLTPDACDNEANKTNLNSKEDITMKNAMNKFLTLEQLDMVNGGTYAETYCDSDMLHEQKYMNYTVSKCDLLFFWERTSAVVDEAWAKAGVTCVSSFDEDNQYFYQGHSITHDQAKIIAKGIQGPKIA